jgi:hypothetical protein
MPIRSKNLFPGATWFAPKDYEQIGTRGTSSLLLVGWTGNRAGVGEPLVSTSSTDNPATEDLGVAELDALLSHGSAAMSIKLTKDPYEHRNSKKEQPSDSHVI